MRLPVRMVRGSWTGPVWAAILAAGCLHAPGGVPMQPPASGPGPVAEPAGPRSNYSVQTASPKIPAETSGQAVVVDPAGFMPPPTTAPPPPPLAPVAAQAPLAAAKVAPDPPLVAALRDLLEKKPATAEALAGLDPSVRDMVLTLLTLAAKVHENELEKAAPQEADAWLAQLRHLSAALRGRAPLLLSKLCFCSLIDGFGVYTALPPDHEFQPGEGVQIYVEVRNFVSHSVGDKHGSLHEINLGGTLEILDFRRDIVYHKDFAVPDRSLTPRQDYFFNYPFRIPARMPAGSYTLRVTVRDGNPAGGIARAALQTCDFKVMPR